jgi:hypothetical protein
MIPDDPKRIIRLETGRQRAQECRRAKLGMIGCAGKI